MKITIAAFLVIIPWSISRAGELPFSHATETSLIYRLETSTMPYHYPHTLQVFLRLENRHDSEMIWGCDSVAGIEAELFDSEGRPVAQSPSAASVPMTWRNYLLPPGSRLDWLVSHGGVTLAGAGEENAALIVGARGWLLPMKSLSSYSLKIRVKGLPQTRPESGAGNQPMKLLFETPRTNIVVK